MGDRWRKLTGQTRAAEAQRISDAAGESGRAQNRAGEARLTKTLNAIKEGRHVDPVEMDWAERAGGNAVKDAQNARENPGHSR